MSHFFYQDGSLHVEEVPLAEIADCFGTPCYVYSRRSIESNWTQFDSALDKNKHLVCYAVKANSNIAILDLLSRLGSGFDIVSVGELHRVIRAGGDPEKVVFSGVGKYESEMRFALKQNIKCFNVESESELFRLNTVAGRMKLVAPVSLRVNPDINTKTHPYISTGLKENKFGIAFDCVKALYEKAAAMKHISIVGIGYHIGSQIIELSPFKSALTKVLRLVDELEQSGIKLNYLDIGGGLGITYCDELPPSPTDYANSIIEMMQDRDLELIVEPGRSITGNAGILITKVEYLKMTPFHNFAIVDAAMNDFIRPSFYNGWHDIKCVINDTDIEKLEYDIVGPICETSDFLGKNRLLGLKQGDLLAVCSAGAYGFSMASNYNSRPRAAEVMVDGKQVYEIQKRECIEDLMDKEMTLPK